MLWHIILNISIIVQRAITPCFLSFSDHLNPRYHETKWRFDVALIARLENTSEGFFCLYNGGLAVQSKLHSMLLTVSPAVLLFCGINVTGFKI